MGQGHSITHLACFFTIQFFVNEIVVKSDGLSVDAEEIMTEYSPKIYKCIEMLKWGHLV